MSFCPRCGAPATPGMSFCTACGENLASPVAPTSAGPGAPPPNVAAPRGPLGKMVAPWKAIVFPIITLGVYVYVFWWRIAREIDAYASARSSPLVRAGVLLSVLGLAGTVIASIIIAWPTFLALAEDPESAPAELDFSDEFVESPLYLGASTLGFIGGIVLWLGLWKAWKALEEDEAKRGAGKRVNAAVYVGILVVSALLAAVSLFVPGLGLLPLAGTAATLWVMYSTQSHLNATWVASGAPASA